jgi:hypothetical protein
VLTWFMDASSSGLQRPHSGTPRPPGRPHHHSPVRLEQAALNDQGIEFALIFTRENHHWQRTYIFLTRH